MTEPPRPALALVLLVAAVFLALGDQCGVLGQYLASFSVHYIGQLGTVLVVLTLSALAYLFGVPVGTAVKFARSFRARRRAPPVRTEGAEPKVLPTGDRRKVDSVRAAMKSLGYLKHEYDPVVASLDLSLPLDQLVRQSILTLHRQKVLS